MNQLPAWVDAIPPTTSFAEVERVLILRALMRTGGNRSLAAKRLGMSRGTMLNRIRQMIAEGVNVPPALGRAR